ncbi:hypothetical protein GCM10009682_45610 [Luedemannella flava]|uniref:Secreted protein n=1 Tax=Luedemannella flava TaxID=349316 RepID=A0ABN2MC01_9ACTN
MSVSTSFRPYRRGLAAATLVLGLVIGTSACGSDMSGMDHGSTPATPPSGSATGHPDMTGMPGMAGEHEAYSGNGLSAQEDGIRFAPASMELPAGTPSSFTFKILGADGAPVTTFEPDQTKLMHFYLIRSDLTGFQHLHPTMAPDGTWTAQATALQPGQYRAYAAFIAKVSGQDKPLVLSEHVTVPGKADTVALPKASATTTVDGYKITLSKEPMMVGMAHPLTVEITKNGKPVTDLEPYLDTKAHLTAFHDGDMAFAHLHPQDGHGGHGGGSLTFMASLGKPGNWRLYLQFQTDGVLHTAAVTLAVA